MADSFFGVTFTATNQSDRKRCDWCGRIVPVADVEKHRMTFHPQVAASDVRIESGITI